MDPRVEVEIARRYLVLDKMGVNGEIDGTGFSTSKGEGKSCPNTNRVEVWHTLPDRILAASPHLQGYDVPGDEIDKLKAQGLTLLEALEYLGIG